MGAAVVGGLLIAWVVDAGPQGYVLAIVGGLLIGYLAPFWIRHVTLP